MPLISSNPSSAEGAVIVDTPPVMAVTDSSVVAHLATGVLFVVGAEMTSRHAAQRALEELEHARAKFIGAVLNGAQPDSRQTQEIERLKRENERLRRTDQARSPDR